MYKGSLIGRIPAKGPGLIATVTRLPEDNSFSPGGSSYIIAISNFSREAGEESLDLARLPDFAAMTEQPVLSLLYGDIGNIQREGNSLIMNIPGWSKALILVEKTSSTAIQAGNPALSPVSSAGKAAGL